MEATINNIMKVYKSKKSFASSTSNSGIVEFSKAVNAICYDYYSQIQKIEANGEFAIYKFIQSKMNNLGWDGYHLTSN
jgi:hypothetical protein